MKPKPREAQLQRELFLVELTALVNESHALVKLGSVMDWSLFEEQLGGTYSEDRGAPGIDTRLMVALHYLKYQHDLSDDAVLSHWVENPYWQHFSGRQFFEHRRPIDSSSMTRWRHRLGEAGAETMLRETIQAALQMKALRPAQITRINVDTTVQTKAVRHPTDARLYDRARERLVKTARGQGLRIKQSYTHVGRRLLMQQSRYAHARQMKRAARCTRKLRTHLGRVIREIQRQRPNPTGPLASLLKTAQCLHAQTRKSKNKVYSVHEPQIACIAKGKAAKRYEFGNKVSVAVTSRGGWLLGAIGLPDNPYDGHTLTAQLTQVRRMVSTPVKQVFVDMGYRGHGHDGSETVVVDKRRRGKTPLRLWRWMKRRAAVEPSIGHLKSEHRLERNRLKGAQGDALNALFSAAAMNFHKLLRVLEAFWLRIWQCLLPLGRSHCFAGIVIPAS